MPNHTNFLFFKPFKVLSQFTDEGENAGYGSVITVPKDVYPIGRLDLDSEGLLILTNDKKLNHLLLNPTHGHSRTYWVEVEGVPAATAIEDLSKGVKIRINKKEHLTLPAEVRILNTVDVPERSPGVNYVKHPETTWLELVLREGKNRQVRRMTAAVGHPTLRLIRVKIENLELLPLEPGELRQISTNVLYKKLNITRYAGAGRDGQ